MIRSGIAVIALLTVAAPFVAVLAEPPPMVPLAERIAIARADFLANPCRGDKDCRFRAASHGLEPEYYEGPDEWLESGCLAKGDTTACAYLAAWREVEAANAPFVGYGCSGASWPLYGDSRKEFPVCAVIEEVHR